MASPVALKFTLTPKAQISLEALFALQVFIKDYHKSSDTTLIKHSGDAHEKEPTTIESICKSKNSNRRPSATNKRKSNRITKTMANKHLQPKKRWRKK
jgi:hypothetical protein